VSGKQIAKYLETSNLAEVRQGRRGNQFSTLVVKLNEQDAALKRFMIAQQAGEKGGS